MSLDYADDIEQDDKGAEAPEAVEQSVAERLIANIRSPNIAADLSEEELARIGARVVDEFKIDEQSRKDSGWADRIEAALKLAMQVKEAKNYPWPNAANIKYPLITVAAVQFAARAYPAIVDGAGIVKGKVLGKPSDEKRDRADRIGRHMSYQLLEEMDGWEEDTDRLLHVLPVVGCVFRKTWFDPVKGYNCSHLISPEKFVVNYWTRDPDSCPRSTQIIDDVYPHQITEKVRAGQWLDHTYGQPQDADNDENAPHTFLEQHRLLDLDGDGYPEPYIVTVHKETGKVARIVARYDEDGIIANDRVVAIKPVRYYTKYGFIPAMDGSFYDIGFGTLLDALNETINTTINQLMDAGHLSNVQGGFIGKGLSIKSGNLRFQPGEWKRVESSGEALSNNIVPLPTREPSSVLFQLLGMLVEAARDITATKDILTGETQQSNQPVGTTLAMIEQGLKVFTAIYKRIHRSLKNELWCLYRLNRLYLDQEVYFTFQDQEGAVALEDYASDDVDVVPVSDPTVVTDMQRLGRAQFLMQFRADPLMNPQEINRRVLEAANIDDVKGLFAEEQPPNAELVAKTAELELKKQELALEERKVVVAENESQANIAKLVTEAQQTAMETLLTAPEFQSQIAAFIDARVAEIADATVRPEDLSGMAGPAPDEGVPPVPEGPPGDFGQGMDGGGEPIPGSPDAGPAPGGVGEPGF